VLYEARKQKEHAKNAEIGGREQVVDNKKSREVVVTNEDTGESKNYPIHYGSRICVNDDEVIEAGDALTEGSVNPHDLLKIKGILAVQNYLLREVQRVYRLQGVDICDKHIEVIVRQMLKKVRIDDAGDSEAIAGTNMNILEFEDMNEALEAEGKTPAKGTQIMLGITKASLATNSFLSAASFQETTRVLTEAAINGKIDPLDGLKENVIIGKLIPAGTGMKRYRSVVLDTDGSDLIDEDEDQLNPYEAVNAYSRESEEAGDELVDDADEELIDDADEELEDELDEELDEEAEEEAEFEAEEGSDEDEKPEEE
jgi:DNA-directed RNA polymerase subunit beta'